MKTDAFWDRTLSDFRFTYWCWVTQSCLTLYDPMDCSVPGFPVLHYLPELAQIHVHWDGDTIQPSHSMSSPSPLPFPSKLGGKMLNFSQHQGLFQWVNSSHQVVKVLELQLQHQSFQKTLGLIFFRIDWFDLLTVKEALKSLLHHQSLKAPIPWHSDFFTVQLSHPYMTTGKNIALTIWTFVGKVMSLLLNMLSRFVITFLPRSKHFLILWLQSLSSVIFKPKKIVCHCFHCFPIYLPWSDGTGCHTLCFLNVKL